MSVAVIVPVYNGADILPVTVPAVLAMDGVDEWVWVDDGSTDNSHTVLTDLLEDKGRARVVRQPANTGRSAARNRGLRETAGQKLVFFDCDVRPPQDAARELASSLRGATIASVASIRPMPGARRDPYAVYLSRFPRGPSRSDVGGTVPWKFFLAGACAVIRSAVVDAGGFNESVPYGEDFALACHLARSHPHGLSLADTTVDLFGIGDLSDALANVRQFGRSLREIEASCPGALRLAGVESTVRSRALRRLSAAPIPTVIPRLVGLLPAPVQVRAVRYLLGHALLAAYHGA